MTIYLIRHAQSAFNAVHDPKKPDPMIFDAPITALGETQARNARSEVKELDINKRHCFTVSLEHYKRPN